MHAIPVIAFLLAALACSLVGRILLVTTAFGVSTGWGFTVLLVPFGPLIFRIKHRELAQPTRYWRLGSGILFILFIVNGGSANSVTSLFQQGDKQGPTEEASAGDTHFHLPVPSKIVAALTHPEAAAEAPSAPADAKPTAASPTPSKAVAASTAAMAPAPKVLSPAERVDANHKEFERLADWYENLRRERGYLKKGDTAAVEAFNADAAKYQAALQLAKIEQAELAKLTATAKK
ncbi:MAG TPA: hypothetical protein VK961_09845 [Chthoniobacter sp.]|nr:hypothetical protein [Chthoniobacter sp.]